MISYVKGLLVLINPTHVIIESKGIGYKIFVPANAFQKLPALHENLTLHTSLVIKELGQFLYGFMEDKERDVFEALLNVNGIGPKTALSLIGHLTLTELKQAVDRDEHVKICKVPGIGKKTAERLVIELRDKLDHFVSSTPHLSFVDIQATGVSQKIKDAMSALINLGYNQLFAQKAIKKTIGELSEEVELGLLITHALKHI